MTEQQIHRAVIQHLQQRGARDLVWLHPANGGFRTPIEAAIFRSLGVRAGAPDLLLWHDGRSYALEIKSDTGRTTSAQIEFLASLKRAGVLVAVARGIDAAIRKLEEWRLLRGVTACGGNRT